MRYRCSKISVAIVMFIITSEGTLMPAAAGDTTPPASIATRAKVPLDEAIARAEKRGHVSAIDAGIAKPLRGTNAVLAYFVETIDGSRCEELAVDAETGAFIQNPDSLFVAHTPVELARRLSPGTG